jgi:hypothetical protein
MAISQENLLVAIDALEVCISRNESGLKRIREYREDCQRNPFLRITFADPVLQAESDREELQRERDLNEKVARRKSALRALRTAVH